MKDGLLRLRFFRIREIILVFCFILGKNYYGLNLCDDSRDGNKWRELKYILKGEKRMFFEYG